MKFSAAILTAALLVHLGYQPAQEQAIEALKKMNADITVKAGKTGMEMSINFAGSAVTNDKMKHLEHLPQVCSIDL